MAAAVNFARGQGPQELNGGSISYRLGNSVTITGAASSVNAALPVDPNGNPYTSVLIVAAGTASAPTIWWDFVTTSGDTVSAAAANVFPSMPGSSFGIVTVVPSSAGFIAAIGAVGLFLTVIGIY